MVENMENRFGSYQQNDGINMIANMLIQRTGGKIPV